MQLFVRSIYILCLLINSYLKVQSVNTENNNIPTITDTKLPFFPDVCGKTLDLLEISLLEVLFIVLVLLAFLATTFFLFVVPVGLAFVTDFVLSALLSAWASFLLFEDVEDVEDESSMLSRPTQSEDSIDFGNGVLLHLITCVFLFSSI